MTSQICFQKVVPSSRRINSFFEALVFTYYLYRCTKSTVQNICITLPFNAGQVGIKQWCSEYKFLCH